MFKLLYEQPLVKPVYRCEIAFWVPLPQQIFDLGSAISTKIRPEISGQRRENITLPVVPVKTTKQLTRGEDPITPRP
jgi:hypothetical protein